MVDKSLDALIEQHLGNNNTCKIYPATMQTAQYGWEGFALGGNYWPNTTKETEDMTESIECKIGAIPETLSDATTKVYINED